jgi:hypothetical protein
MDKSNEIEQQTANMNYTKDRVSCYKDSFVDNGTLVFQIKFFG